MASENLATGSLRNGLGDPTYWPTTARFKSFRGGSTKARDHSFSRVVVLSLRRQLLSSFVLQGAGAASVLVATLALGLACGPEVQGGFSRTKSEIEFASAFAMLGLPQALFFHMKSGRLGMPVALRWALGSAVLALLLGSAYALIRHGNATLLVCAGFGLAVAATVAHGQLRALLLVRERVEWFNVLTALPQVLMLLGVACVIGSAKIAPGMPIWIVLFTLAYGSVAMLALRRLSRVESCAPTTEISWREIGNYGAASWLMAALSTAAILVTQHGVEAREGGAALGIFTMALTLTQVPLTPISYAAPLLWRHWMEHPGRQASWRGAGVLLVLLLGVAVVVWWLAGPWPDLGLGDAYSGVTRALAVLLAGGAAEAASRVLAAHANASGLPWIGVRAEIARWGVLVVGWSLPLSGGLLTLCAIWAGAGTAAMLVFAQHAWATAEN